MLKLSSILIVALLMGCGGGGKQLMKRELVPTAAETIQEISARPKVVVGLASLFDLQMELLGQCDSCHGASANFWEFEYDNKLDSLAQLLWPESEIVRLVPDVPPFTEADTLLDSLSFWLSRWEGVGEQLCAAEEESASRNTLELSPQAVEWATALHQQYKIDLLLLPGPTTVRLYPDGNRPKGKVEVDHLFSVWELQQPLLLYRSCQKRSWKTKGSEQIDRQTTPPLLLPLFSDLKQLTGR